MHVLDVISYSDTGSKTDTIKGVPTDRSVRVWNFHGYYKVTDVGIVAGEDFDGYISLLRVMGSLKKGDRDVEIMRVERNELVKLCKFLAPAGLAQYHDSLPTTAENQNFWFSIGLPVDLRIYKSVWVEWTSQTAITEWGAASAMELHLALDLETGPVERSYIASRFYRSTDTTHDFKVGDGTITDIMIFPGTADYITEVSLPGSDGVMDWVLHNGYTIPGKIIADVMRGAVSTTDVVDMLRSGPIMNEYYDDRQLHILAGTTTTILVFAKVIASISQVSTKTTLGDAARGETKLVAQTVNLGGSFKSETGRKLSATPMNQLSNTQAMSWFRPK